MKIYKSFFILLGSVISLLVISCVKTDDQTYIDFTKAPAIVEFTSLNSGTPSGSLAGVAGMKKAAISFAASDTIKFVFLVNYAGQTSAPKDIQVTLGINDALRTAYNTANSTNFQLLPTNCYKLAASTVTIKKGTQYAYDSMYVYNQIDPSVSYMLPLNINDASGVTLTSNENSIYFNFIGNPIAGNYTWNWTRYSGQDTTAPLYGGSFTGATTSAAIDSPTQVEFLDNYYTTVHFVLSFTNTNGVLSKPQLSLNSNDLKAFTNGGITITAGPTIVTCDFVNKHFKFTYQAFNGSAYRFMIDEYWIQ